MTFLKTILDTNAYGIIIAQEKDIELKERIDERKDIIIFGNRVIRRELEETPENIPANVEEKRKLRMRLLELYEFLVKDHDLKITGLITFLADKYIEQCKQIVKVREDKLLNDFLIVACASFHGLDVVVSEDNRTMLSEQALKAYKRVNEKEQLRTPKFMTVKEFEAILKM